jgi:lipid-A-disaccharide synthase-like uncharacterized protein
MPTFLAWLQIHMNPWVVIGLCGQAFFMMRFVVQWIASERARQSIVPQTFWYFSLGGGVILFIYALHQEDIVFTLGQGLGLFIYLRNLYFIHSKKRDANG